jgi:hypothetical protein
VGQFNINGTFSNLPDPSGWTPEGIAERDSFVDGAPLLQGLESGVVSWNAITQTEYGELHTRWNANKGVLTSGKLPEESGSALGTYDTVASAYWHEPLGEARGGLRMGVRMRITFITRS